MAPLVFPDYKSFEFSSIQHYSGAMVQSQFSLGALQKLSLTPEEATVARKNCLLTGRNLEELEKEDTRRADRAVRRDTKRKVVSVAGDEHAGKGFILKFEKAV